MKTIAYLQLKNEASFDEKLEQLTGALKECIDVAKNNRQTLQLLYDKQSMKKLYDDIEEWRSEFSELNNAAGLIGDFLNVSDDWQDSRYQQSSARYFCWDLAQEQVFNVNDSPLAEIAERKLTGHQAYFLFINLQWRTNSREFFYVFKDAFDLSGAPSEILRLDFVDDVNGLQRWLNTHIPPFSLENNPQFRKTNRVRPQSKQSIYEELSTGCFWYFDFYHKDNKLHYEVFNAQGKHLGEADAEGRLKEGTADHTKKLTL